PGDHGPEHARPGALRARLAIRAAEEIDADGQQEEIWHPHGDPRLNLSGDRELLTIVQHDVVNQDDHHTQRKTGALSSSAIRDTEGQSENSENKTRAGNGELFVNLH